MEACTKKAKLTLRMFKIHLIFSLILIFVSALQGWSQTHGTGMVFDDISYDAVPLKAKLILKSYVSLPTSASLKSYCPDAGDQGSYGTCVGWASAWAARTILYAQSNKITSKALITSSAFAPLFVYHHAAAVPDEVDCKNGAKLPDAMLTLKNNGVPFYKDFPKKCTQTITTDIENKASKNKIKDYNKIFETTSTNDEKIQITKKSLSNGYPVVIGVICPPSLFSTTMLWKPTEQPLVSYGGHALCVIGYDDTKYGGAFEIINSWGTDWGNAGFFWVKYADYAKFSKYGFELYPLETKTINEVDLSGEIQFVLSDKDSTKLAVTKNSAKEKGQNSVINDLSESISDYIITKSLVSGTSYRILLSNNEPAYVYVISSDLKKNTSILFPYKTGISPYLSYKSNEIVLPDENYSIKLDDNKGTDYTCILYSKDTLNIKSIMAQIKKSTDTFRNSVYTAIGTKLVAKENVILSEKKISFKATSKGKSVVAIIVEITHL